LETENTNNPHIPIVLPREAHNISRSNISESALKVLYRLMKSDYDAFLVGGGVRDLLLERHPKDFDVVTDALPEDASQLFRNSRLIGRRFRLVHVHFGKDIIEVATFRGQDIESEQAPPGDRHTRNGMIIRDNVYGTIEQDAWRRDFTINSLYYNIQDFTVIDYTGGLEDLRNKQIRMIGDPYQRYCEDPVRMLRAARFAAKLNFNIEPLTESPIFELAERLLHVPPARLFEEVLKLFLSGHALATYQLLRKYKLFDQLFPDVAQVLQEQSPFSAQAESFIQKGLANTDERIEQGKPVTPAFLFAILLWVPLQSMVKQNMERGLRYTQALQHAAADIVSRQVTTVSLPKRFSMQSREIWAMQPRLQNRVGKRAFRLLASPRFRAAYDFLVLRADTIEPELRELCDWWTQFQAVGDKDKSSMIKQIQPTRRRPRRAWKKNTAT